MKKALWLLLCLALLLTAAGCADSEALGELVDAAAEVGGDILSDVIAEAVGDGSGSAETPDAEIAADIAEDGSYSSKEDVALYLHTYGRLPGNFMTKSEAKSLGWEGGSLEPYAPGKSIGGDRFGNYEGLLPEKDGRSYTECDIDSAGASSRGAKRIVFSNDGLVYYTDDHYESFTLLYGEE